jgi:hypothetical protein
LAKKIDSRSEVADVNFQRHDVALDPPFGTPPAVNGAKERRDAGAAAFSSFTRRNARQSSGGA